MNQNQAKINDYDYSYGHKANYQSDVIQPNLVIEGYFPKETQKKEMAIRKINTILTILVGVFIFMTAISYYFATANEMVLNNLSRQTIVLNDENADLQNKLDKLKSFNNVDLSMQKTNLLQKAQQVIEVPAVSSTNVTNKKLNIQKPFVWAVGY